MRSVKPANLPTGLKKARQRFEDWRKKRKKVSRIPEELWAVAVDAARHHGVNQAALALGLDYNHLKRRTRAGKRQGSVLPEERAPAFMELMVPPASRLSECTIELENPQGAKMKIHLQSVEVKEVTELSRAFWGERQ
jgi:hypothetical protein